MLLRCAARHGLRQLLARHALWLVPGVVAGVVWHEPVAAAQQLPAELMEALRAPLPSSAPDTPVRTTEPLMLIYNPMRPAALSVFKEHTLRFMQAGQQQRARFNTLTPHAQVQFLERHVFGLCHTAISDGLDKVYGLETGNQGFCGYSPDRLACYAARTCDAATQAQHVRFIQASLRQYDEFVAWSQRRQWRYQGDAMGLALYARIERSAQGRSCAYVKLINGRTQPVIVHLKASLEGARGRSQPVWTTPYYVPAQASLPNVGDENLFNPGTEARMRRLTRAAMQAAAAAGLMDIAAYSGPQERGNCMQDGQAQLRITSLRLGLL